MPQNRNIDIRGTDWPICILNCKKEIDRMKNGEKINIIANDIDVVNNLIALLEQIAGYKSEKQKTAQYYILIVSRDEKAI